MSNMATKRFKGYKLGIFWIGKKDFSQKHIDPKASIYKEGQESENGRELEEFRGINLVDVENPEKGAAMEKSELLQMTGILHKLWKENGVKVAIIYTTMSNREL